MSLAVMQADNFDGLSNLNAEFVTLYTTTTLTAGQWVSFATNDVLNPGAIDGLSVVAAISSTTGHRANICGVADQAVTPVASAQTAVRIQIAGYRASANVATATTDGCALACGGTAGLAQLASGVSTNDYRVCGRGLSDASGDVAEVEIFPHPTFIR